MLDLGPEANTSTLDRDESEEEELDGDHDIPYFSENMVSIQKTVTRKYGRNS